MMSVVRSNAGCELVCNDGDRSRRRRKESGCEARSAVVPIYEMTGDNRDSSAISEEMLQHVNSAIGRIERMVYKVAYGSSKLRSSIDRF